MPRPVALALPAIACIVAAALPAAAQEQGNWAAVQELKPGAEVVVATDAAPRVSRLVVLADTARLTVLNLTDPDLPGAAARTLRGINEGHPEFFARATKGSRFLDGNVQVSSDGVFVAGRKVADLSVIVETIARTDIAEISTRQRGRGFWGHLGPFGGYFVGAMAGGYISGFACKGAGGRSCDGAFLGGLAAGGVAGAVQGFIAARRETEVLVYTR